MTPKALAQAFCWHWPQAALKIWPNLYPESCSEMIKLSRLVFKACQMVADREDGIRHLEVKQNTCSIINRLCDGEGGGWQG